MGTPPLSSTKEEIAVVVLTSDVLQGLLGVLSPHHFNFFEILALACISLLPLPVLVNNYQLFRVDSWPFLHLLPPLVCFMLFGSFFGGIVTVLVKFFKSISQCLQKRKKKEREKERKREREKEKRKKERKKERKRKRKKEKKERKKRKERKKERKKEKERKKRKKERKRKKGRKKERDLDLLSKTTGSFRALGPPKDAGASFSPRQCRRNQRMG